MAQNLSHSMDLRVFDLFLSWVWLMVLKCIKYELTEKWFTIV